MSVDRFWDVVAEAREAVGDPADAEEVAEEVLRLLCALPPEEIAELAQPLWDLRAWSYRRDLWRAGYLINGGCSDDGFEYFRGWLLTQGRETFERAVAEPDSLADLPAVRHIAAGGGPDLECESMFGVVWDAYGQVTGTMELPREVTGEYPELEPWWDLDGADGARRRLPRLAALFQVG